MSFRWKIAQTAELKWWQNYLSAKPIAEYQAWKADYWRGFLKEVPLELPKGARILDAGCGPAGLFTILPDHEVTACDPLLDAYAEKLSHFEPKDYPWTKFVNSALEDFETEEGFDYIFCINAINHVDNLGLALDQLIKALKPGGQLILSIDAHNHDWLKRIFQWLPGDILHPHQYNRAEYRKMMTERGIVLGEGKRLNKERIFSYWVEWGSLSGKM